MLEKTSKDAVLMRCVRTISMRLGAAMAARTPRMVSTMRISAMVKPAAARRRRGRMALPALVDARHQALLLAGVREAEHAVRRLHRAGGRVGGDRELRRIGRAGDGDGV